MRICRREEIRHESIRSDDQPAEMHCLEHTLDFLLEAAALENPLWIHAGCERSIGSKRLQIFLQVSAFASLASL